MTVSEPDYSAYIAYHHIASNTYGMLMGFTFTSTVVLLTWLPDPAQIKMQIILFFLAVMFNVLGFLLFNVEAILAYCVRVAPRLPPGYKGGILVRLSNLVWYMLAGMISLMFLAWDLVYLALASAVVGVLLIVLARMLARPFYEKVGERWTRR